MKSAYVHQPRRLSGRLNLKADTHSLNSTLNTALIHTPDLYHPSSLTHSLVQSYPISSELIGNYHPFAVQHRIPQPSSTPVPLPPKGPISHNSTQRLDMPSRLSRTTGALLALHAGDSLGATLEFKSHAAIKASHPLGLRSIVGGGPFSWPPGHATDDTDLTRAVLLSYADSLLLLLHSSPDANQQHRSVTYRAAEYFVAWYEGRWPDVQKAKGGNTPRDVGGSTAEGILAFAGSGDPTTSGTGPGRAGNGSLMRCLPTGLFQRDVHLMLAESRSIGAVTHRDETCQVSCAVYNAIAAALVAGADVSYALSQGEAVAVTMEGGREGDVLRAIRRGRRTDIAQLARDGPPREHYPGRCSGHVLESLSLAIAAILDRRSLEDILVDVVRIGADTDTNAAIAGGLLGARDGEEAIPKAWVDTLQFRDEFREVARAIHKVQYGRGS